jgi:hemin uptake protein HemP
MKTHPNTPSPTPKAPSSQPQKVMDVEHLLDGTRELILKFHDEEYRLRITRNEKLILTK